jgi:Holliday junction resolvase RusA-like endonuclease
LLRIEKYNNYKISLSAEAKNKKFAFPSHGISITFFIPVPPSWSKKKKKLHHGMLHQSTPDLSNLLKAMEDSMVSEDKYIAQYSACKRWVDFEDGWIEIEVNETPCQVTITPPVKE